MKRFYEDDSDDSQDAHFFDGEFTEEGPEQYIESYVMGYDLAEEELKHHTMEKAIEIAKGNWRWYFKSSLSKMKDISLIYSWLITMIESEDDEDHIPDEIDESEMEDMPEDE